jgi:tRNA U34 2-thiouridine synthase MnmA/TrmU
MTEAPIRAIGLFSGGLDSSLAIRLMRDLGVEVMALHVRTGFSYVERNRVAGRAEVAGLSDIELSASRLGVPLTAVDASEAYLPVVLHPRYGYGSGMNPCVDCRIFLLRVAGKMMAEHGYHFVFTGEVVGQRPKSQKRPALRTVERESGLTGYLLRPLSAKLLEPTVPELKGWVDRDRLLDISGRGRKRQIALAEKYGITEYAQPSGGCCYLIDQRYSARLRDYLSEEGADALTVSSAQLLAVGRHFRLPSGARLVLGRHERENAYLESRASAGTVFRTADHPGPTALLLGAGDSADDIVLAAQVAAAYSDARDQPSVRVDYRGPANGDLGGSLDVEPADREHLRSLAV